MYNLITLLNGRLHFEHPTKLLRLVIVNSRELFKSLGSNHGQRARRIKSLRRDLPNCMAILYNLREWWFKDDSEGSSDSSEVLDSGIRDSGLPQGRGRVKEVMQVGSRLFESNDLYEESKAYNLAQRGLDSPPVCSTECHMPGSRFLWRVGAWWNLYRNASPVLTVFDSLTESGN